LPGLRLQQLRPDLGQQLSGLFTTALLPGALDAPQPGELRSAFAPARSHCRDLHHVSGDPSRLTTSGSSEAEFWLDYCIWLKHRPHFATRRRVSGFNQFLVG